MSKDVYSFWHYIVTSERTVWQILQQRSYREIQVPNEQQGTAPVGRKDTPMYIQDLNHIIFMKFMASVSSIKKR